MKKIFLFLIVFLLAVSISNAATCPSTPLCGHGVEIDSVKFPCSASDNICPNVVLGEEGYCERSDKCGCTDPDCEITVVDKTPPEITTGPIVFIDKITATSADINWETNEPANSTVEYGITINYNNIVSARDFVTNRTITLTGLKPGKIYYKVCSTDKANNKACSLGQIFQTLLTPDTIPPIISDILTSDITSTTAKINWATNEGSNSTVEYGNTIDYDKIKEDAIYTTDHSITLTQLTPNTYHYKVCSTDRANNKACSEDKTFITTTLPCDLSQAQAIWTDADNQPIIDLSTGVVAGTPLKLYLINSKNCNTKIVNFEVFESDRATISGITIGGIDSTSVTQPSPISTVITNNIAYTTWTTQYKKNDGDNFDTFGNPEFLFQVLIDTTLKESSELTVTTAPIIPLVAPTTCSIHSDCGTGEACIAGKCYSGEVYQKDAQLGGGYFASCATTNEIFSCDSNVLLPSLGYVKEGLCCFGRCMKDYSRTEGQTCCGVSTCAAGLFCDGTCKKPTTPPAQVCTQGACENNKYCNNNAWQDCSLDPTTNGCCLANSGCKAENILSNGKKCYNKNWVTVDCATDNDCKVDESCQNTDQGYKCVDLCQDTSQCCFCYTRCLKEAEKGGFPDYNCKPHQQLLLEACN